MNSQVTTVMRDLPTSGGIFTSANHDRMQCKVKEHFRNQQKVSEKPNKQVTEVPSPPLLAVVTTEEGFG